MILLKNLNKWGGVILLLAMFVMFNSEARASSGTYSISAGGCEYIVEVNFLCQINTLFSSSYSVEGFSLTDPSCTTTLSVDEIANAISNKIAEDPFLYFPVCTTVGYPPCSSQFREVWRQAEPLCWKRLDFPGGTQYAACDEGYCYTDWKYCFDGINVIQTLDGFPRKIPGGVCPGDPDVVSLLQYGNCFPVKTNCD